jgi:hypothetical protein
MPFVTSDPHAWLYPIYARLRADTKFGLLSSVHQFEALAAAVEKESLTKGSAMREWNAAAQIAMLKWLSDVTQEHPNPTNEIEQWRVRKNDRELHCLTVYVPIGIDVRLMEGEGFRRTHLCKDAPEAHALSDKWRAALVSVGWIVGDPHGSTKTSNR